jgi:hypothetical protein
MARYLFEGKLNDKVKDLCVQLTKVVPSLNYINPEDFMVVIALRKSPKIRATGDRTLASMEHPSHWMMDWVERLIDGNIPDFYLTVYPLFFRCKFIQQVKVLIHELWHISPNKKGIRPHIGFGDEVITEMFKKNLKKIRRLKN